MTPTAKTSHTIGKQIAHSVKKNIKINISRFLIGGTQTCVEPYIVLN